MKKVIFILLMLCSYQSQAQDFNNQNWKPITENKSIATIKKSTTFYVRYQSDFGDTTLIGIGTYSYKWNTTYYRFNTKIKIVGGKVIDYQKFDTENTRWKFVKSNSIRRVLRNHYWSNELVRFITFKNKSNYDK